MCFLYDCYGYMHCQGENNVTDWKTLEYARYSVSRRNKEKAKDESIGLVGNLYDQ